MLNQEDDLDLLLSLQDRVLETPPGSPSAPQPSSPGKSRFFFFLIFCCCFLVSVAKFLNFLIQMLVSTLLDQKFNLGVPQFSLICTFPYYLFIGFCVSVAMFLNFLWIG